MIEFRSLESCNSVLWFYSCRSLKEAFNIVINFCVQNRASLAADIEFYLFGFYLRDNVFNPLTIINWLC